MHWLCLTTSGGYVLKLHIRTAQVTVTALPVSFPCSSASGWGTDYLMATATAGRELMVVVLISTIWTQQTKWTSRVLIGGAQPMEGWWAPVT